MNSTCTECIDRWGEEPSAWGESLDELDAREIHLNEHVVPLQGTPGRWLYTDNDSSPPRNKYMEERVQVWAWMLGPGGGHFEVRGTGVIWDG